jgi:TRAP-type uncharacterized transport system fused permease subunit
VIIGALSVTGVAHSFSTEIIALARGNIVLLLLLGAVTSFILGMGMTITACYVFLALILAPALVNSGLDPLAVHLYIMYWGMASYITPPVALSSFTAAGIAGGNPMATGFKSVQLGFVIYLIPFMMVLNPAIILHGSYVDILVSFIFATVAMGLLAYSFEGYIPKLGAVSNWLKPIAIIGGVCLGLPWLSTRLAGAVVLAGVLSFMFVSKNRKRKEAIE